MVGAGAEEARMGGRMRRVSAWLAGVVPMVVALVAGTAGSGRGQTGAPLAEVNGEVITADEVDRALTPQLARLHEQIAALRRQRLEGLVLQKLLQQEAARRGLTVPQLLDAEVNAKASPLGDGEIEAFYQANRGRLPLDEGAARRRARDQLQHARLATAREAFLRSLRDGAHVVIHLPPGALVRVEVPTAGAPARGPAGALVSVVAFSDFHCPFCKRANATLDQLRARYGDRIRQVFRDFPMDQLHPHARRAHEAARCAHEQGQFWAYHDVLFDQAPRAGPDDLRDYARQVGLDLPAFEACVAGGRHGATVRREVEEGVRLGVQGTPTFFVNGRLITGAQPLEVFIQVIEDELRRLAERR
jgi:protein-disulfide isomerase